MGGWIMSIVGVISLGVLLDILIPEGQTNKYIKGIFAVITLLVVISPLPKLFKQNLNIDNIFDYSNEIELDDNFLNKIDSDRHDYRNISVQKILEQKGYKGVKVMVVKNNLNLSKIDYVNVYLSQAVLPKNKSHIDITAEIKAVVADFLGINKDDVRVLYG